MISVQHKLVTLTLLLIFVVCSGTLSFAKTLFSDDFSKGANRWEVGAGKWGVKNGQYVQSTTDAFLSSFASIWQSFGTFGFGHVFRSRELFCLLDSFELWLGPLATFSVQRPS